MRVLIFEPAEGGHRLQYIRTMLPALVPLAQVTVALRQSVPGTEDFKVMLGDLSQFGDRVSLDASIPAGPLFAFGTQWKSIAALRRITAATQADRIYIPNADVFAQVMGLSRLIGRRGFPRSVPCEALILRGTFAYPNPGGWTQRMKQSLTWRLGALAPTRITHLLDPIVYERLLRDDPPAGSHYRLMPDPVEAPETTDRIAARRALGLPEDGRYVGCAGFIDLRKGIDLLIRAMRDAGLRPNDRLLLAGKHYPDVHNLLRGEFASLVQAGRIISIDRLLEAHELRNAISAMDLVCTPYPLHYGSASILIRASAAGRPVLAQNWGWMEFVVKRFGLGWTCNALDPKIFASALEDSLNRAADFQLNEAGRRYVEFHTVGNFNAHWTVELRRLQGLGPMAELRTWDWVMDAVGR